MTQDQQRVIECTTSKFDGLISLIRPEESWVAKWQRIGMWFIRQSIDAHVFSLEKRTPGLYAVKTSGRLPDYLHEKMYG